VNRNADKAQSQRPTEPVLKKRQETIGRVQQLIREYIAGKGFEVVLFGSARYGVDTFKSDLDLVVLVRAVSQVLRRC
jgi:DNA polymerase sigma